MNLAIFMTVLGEGLTLVSSLLERGTPEAVTTAKGLVEKLLGAHSGAITPEDVEKALQELRNDLATNDDAADAALRARFAEAGK